MTSPLVVLQSLPEGSSGTGISYYSEAVRCSRKAQLNRVLEKQSQAGNLRIDAGKIFHSMAEIYYGQNTDNIAVELSDVNLGEAPDEARRLFSAYAARFSPQDFAKIVGVEVLLPPAGDSASLTVVEAAVGVSPFTLRIDLVVEVDGRSAAILEKKRGLILEPGTYLWDYKTKGQKDSNAELVYRHSAQFIAYQHVWNSLHPENPCKGMVADIIVAHKKLVDDSFYSILVPPPTQTQIAGLKRWLQNAKKQVSLDEPNWLACFEFGKACTHLRSGACNRA